MDNLSSLYIEAGSIAHLLPFRGQTHHNLKEQLSKQRSFPCLRIVNGKMWKPLLCHVVEMSLRATLNYESLTVFDATEAL